MNDQQQSTPNSSVQSDRLAQFEDEVAKLKVTGGGANPERLGAQWGIGLTIVGFVVAIVAYWSALDSKDTNTQLRSQIIAVIAVGVALVGIIIWLRNSLTRYMRYWLIRLVFEQREQTDQIVKALRDK
jgi:hypothetical protein